MPDAAAKASLQPSTDPVRHYPELAGLRAAVQQRDWGAIQAFFDEVEQEDDRVVASQVVSGAPGALAFLGGIAEAPSAPVLARVLLAGTLVVTAWAVRTGARAQHVSQGQFRTFHGYLRKAERQLIEAVADDPACGLAWYTRLITARGLELGQAEARRRYDRLAEHHPHVFGAQSQYLQQLCPKWSGSWEAAHAFAEECRSNAPAGSLGAAVTAHAHIEHWLDLEKGERSAYLLRAETVADIRAAAARLTDAPILGRGYCRPRAHGGFAFLLAKLGRPAEARRHFDVIAENPWIGEKSLPWGNLQGGAVDSYTVWRDRNAQHTQADRGQK